MIGYAGRADSRLAALLYSVIARLRSYSSKGMRTYSLEIASCSSAARGRRAQRCLVEVLGRHRLLIVPYRSVRGADGLDLLELRVHHEGAEAVGFLSPCGANNDHVFAVRLAWRR